jgi:hypothetical protein
VFSLMGPRLKLCPGTKKPLAQEGLPR